MSTAAATRSSLPSAVPASIPTVAELLHDLGDIPAYRVLLNPAPGTATEEDVIRFVDGDEKVLCELVNGTLVEKALGIREARLAAAVIAILGNFLRGRNLGFLLGADAMLLMTGGNIRLPDVSFISWADAPGGKIPDVPVGRFPATLAIEVLSKSNTKREMEIKRSEYFASGSKLVWEIDPQKRSVTVYVAPDVFTTLGEADTLDGGDVLPGFTLPLTQLFAELDRSA